MQVELSKHQQAEFARCAQAMYANGENSFGHALSAAAAVGSVDVTMYPLLHHAYCAWLALGIYPEASERAELQFAKEWLALPVQVGQP